MTCHGPERPGARADGSRLSVLACRWSWRLATIAGIGIHIHATFLLLLLFLAFSDLVAGHGVTVMASGALLTLAFLATAGAGPSARVPAGGISGRWTAPITLVPRRA
jgi:hypothetical protein